VKISHFKLRGTISMSPDLVKAEDKQKPPAVIPAAGGFKKAV
jgi:hypothetical protein